MDQFAQQHRQTVAGGFALRPTVDVPGRNGQEVGDVGTDRNEILLLPPRMTVERRLEIGQSPDEGAGMQGDIRSLRHGSALRERVTSEDTVSCSATRYNPFSRLRRA